MTELSPTARWRSRRRPRRSTAPAGGRNSRPMVRWRRFLPCAACVCLCAQVCVCVEVVACSAWAPPHTCLPDSGRGCGSADGFAVDRLDAGGNGGRLVEPVPALHSNLPLSSVALRIVPFESIFESIFESCSSNAPVLPCIESCAFHGLFLRVLLLVHRSHPPARFPPSDAVVAFLTIVTHGPCWGLHRERHAPPFLTLSIAFSISLVLSLHGSTQTDAVPQTPCSTQTDAVPQTPCSTLKAVVLGNQAGAQEPLRPRRCRAVRV